MVCPTGPNSMAAAYKILQMPMISQKVVTQNFLREFNMLLLIGRLNSEFTKRGAKKALKSIKKHYDNSTYQACFNGNTTRDESCNLLQVCSSLLKSFKFGEARQLLFSYVAEKRISQEPLSEDSFIEWVHNKTGKRLLNIGSTITEEKVLFENMGVFHLYMTLFPIIKTSKELFPVKTLKSYNFSSNLTIIQTREQFVELLPWLLMSLGREQPSKLMLKSEIGMLNTLDSTLDKALRIYLGQDLVHKETGGVTNIFDHLKPDSTYTMEHYLSMDVIEKYITNNKTLASMIPIVRCDDGNLGSLSEVCSNNSSRTCVDYCQKLKLMDVAKKDRLSKYLEMAYADETAPPFGMLSYPCRHPANGFSIRPESCWTKIVTNQGVCYTSKDGTSTKIPFIFVLYSLYV